MRFITLTIIFIFTSGCTSVYHLGANVNSNGNALYRPVPKKVASELRTFEEECIIAIKNADVDKIFDLSNHSLQKTLDKETLQLQLSSIKLNFELSDNFEIVKLSDLKTWLDDTIFQDQYKIYDFIASQYEVTGKQSINILLLIDKKDGFKLWGFSIHPYSSEDKKSELTYFSKEIKVWWTFGVNPYRWWDFAN